jgi:DNA-directed RNA polymerase sigma subunit (sigma70/sigma32)
MKEVCMDEFEEIRECSTEKPDTGLELALDRLVHIIRTPDHGGLTQMEFDVIVSRFGFQVNGHRHERKLLSEIGAEKHLSKERIRQIENEGLKKLKLAMVEDPVLK